MSPAVAAPEEVSRIVVSVWRWILGVDDVPVAGAPRVPGAVVGVPAKRPGLRASIRITGRWDGSVTLSCSRPAAAAAAALMLGRPADTVAEGDVRDAVGELANIVGGGVKGLLPGHNVLSLPSVEPVELPAGSDPGCALTLSWRAEPVTVTVLGGVTTAEASGAGGVKDAGP